jgi:hypothetical protein
MRYIIVKLLGGQCVECEKRGRPPETDWRALQIDHVNGGGSKERKECKTPDRYYKKVAVHIKINPNQTKYQLLCGGCNMIKREENEEYGKRVFISEQEINSLREILSEEEFNILTNRFTFTGKT